MRVVIADIKGRGGFVNKDTVVGGYGSRFRGFSWTTRWIERVRKLFQNVPSIHAGYLAAIFEGAGIYLFACTLSTAELQERRATILGSVRNAVLGRSRIPGVPV